MWWNSEVTFSFFLSLATFRMAPSACAAHVAFDHTNSLGPYIVVPFVAHSHTPHDYCVRFAPAVTDDRATLAARRPATALPGPDFHRLDRTSLAWRTGTCTPRSRD